MDEFTPRRAVRSQARLKLAVTGPSNSGKTFSSLALACALASLVADAEGRPGTGKVLGIDTENDSMALYSDEFDFEHISFKAPYTTARYKLAMQEAVKGHYDVLLVDTITHQWQGEGGIQSRKDALDAEGGNSFTNWAKLSPEHTGFIEFIKQFPIHTICTMRSKTEYVLETNARGKQQPRKVGTAPIQREGMDYEFTMVFDLDADHTAAVMKDRTRLNGQPLFSRDERYDLASYDVAMKLWKWLTSGAKVEEKLLDHDDKVTVAAALKNAGIPKEEFSAWLLSTMSYESLSKVPKSRMIELMRWITEPRDMSNAEKIARQSMDAMKMETAAKAQLIAKHNRNWDAINAELETQATSFDPAEESQEGEFFEENGDVQCVVLEAVRKESTNNREYFDIKMNGKVEGVDRAVCWHKSLFPALSDSKGQIVRMQITSKTKDGTKYLTVEDVSAVGDRRYEKGKIVPAAGPGPEPTE